MLGLAIGIGTPAAAKSLLPFGDLNGGVLVGFSNGTTVASPLGGGIQYGVSLSGNVSFFDLLVQGRRTEGLRLGDYFGVNGVLGQAWYPRSLNTDFAGFGIQLGLQVGYVIDNDKGIELGLRGFADGRVLVTQSTRGGWLFGGALMFRYDRVYVDVSVLYGTAITANGRYFLSDEGYYLGGRFDWLSGTSVNNNAFVSISPYFGFVF